MIIIRIIFYLTESIRINVKSVHIDNGHQILDHCH